MIQLSLFEEEKTIEEELIEQGLRRGSGFEGGKKRIHEFALTNPPVSSFASFLKDEYGVGGFGSPDRTPFKINGEHHDAKGIEWKYNDDRGEEKEIFVDWNHAAKVIIQMVKEGEYL